MDSYAGRIVDAELDELLAGLPAISLEGPKGVGKTATAQRRAATILPLDDVSQLELLVADPARLDTSPTLVLSMSGSGTLRCGIWCDEASTATRVQDGSC